MRKYLIDAKQEYSSEEISIIPLRNEDKELIRVWRNEQMYHLRQTKPLTAHEQDEYFENVINKLFEQQRPGQLLFSILLKGLFIGYGGLVHINWRDNYAEISFLVETSILENKKKYENLFSYFLKVMVDMAFRELCLNRLFTETYAFRKFHLGILEKNGFIFEGRHKSKVFIDGRYVDTIFHSKINN